jgi:hypothetical protein
MREEESGEEREREGRVGGRGVVKMKLLPPELDMLRTWWDEGRERAIRERREGREERRGECHTNEMILDPP